MLLILFFLVLYFIYLYFSYHLFEKEKKTIIIVFTGACGVGKTTSINILYNFLINKGKKVYKCNELILSSKCKRVLKLLYSQGVNQEVSLLVQYILIEEYKLFFENELPKLKKNMILLYLIEVLKTLYSLHIKILKIGINSNF